MKYLRLGIGCDRITPSSVRITCDIGFESTKPANEKVRNIIVATLFALAFVASVSLASDPVTHPELTVTLSEVLP